MPSALLWEGGTSYGHTYTIVNSTTVNSFKLRTSRYSKVKIIFILSNITQKRSTAQQLIFELSEQTFRTTDQMTADFVNKCNNFDLVCFLAFSLVMN